MAQTTLDRILYQLKTLKTEELEKLSQAIQHQLIPKDMAARRDNFYRALIDNGLVKQIKPVSDRKKGERKRVPVAGKLMSESIIEERR